MTGASLFSLIGVALALALLVWLFVVIARMARLRGHSPWPWWIVALVTSPIVTIVLLWLFFDPRRGADMTGTGGASQ